MKNIKDELQHIIFGDEQAGRTSQLKKVQTFLRRHAETGNAAQNQKRFKSEEAAEFRHLKEGHNMTCD
jgi:soluble cytochrome b562